MTSPLAARSVSTFDISAGTSMALESYVSGPNKSLNEDYSGPKEDLNKADVFLINVLTLLRNMLNAVGNDVTGVKPEDLATYVMQEMTTIKEALTSSNGTKRDVVFYICSYASVLNRKWNDAVRIRIPKSDKEIQRQSLIMAAVTRLKLWKHDHSVLFFDSSIRVDLATDRHKNAVLVSHYPYDLLSGDNFKTCVLLESHTGKVKSKPSYYTKYHTNDSATASLASVPFRKYFLPVFGDGTLFLPMSKKIRDSIVDIGVKHKWSHNTPDSKVFSDIKSTNDMYLLAVLKSFI